MAKFNKVLATIALVFGAAVFINLGSAGAANAACVDNLYKKGSSGTCVKYIQKLNNQYAPRYANNLSVDGSFGTLTDKSIRKLQSKWDLRSDGIVGNKTWGFLCTYQAGWIDANGNNHMAVPDGWPLSTAKAAGCAKYWKGSIVDGVRY